MKNRTANRSFKIPGGVWALGFVSLLMDVSSEMIHSLLPLFMVLTLNTGVFAVGLLEGLAESTALVVKVFSGTLSDYFGKRKPIAALGYALAAFTKPLFALASGAGLIYTARLVDRVGKGIRGAPRDALIADLTPASVRGAAFGLRQSLDTIGAFAGPLLAIALMLLWGNDFRAVFWVAVIPAFLSFVLILFWVKEPVKKTAHVRKNPISRANLKRLSPFFWQVVSLGAVFTLARFSEAFLVLRSQKEGLPIAWVPLVMVVMNVIYAATAYPFGKLSDRMNRQLLLALGLVVLIVSDLFLAVNGHWGFALIGVVLWGVHMGMTQGLFSAMVADAAPSDLRGTAYGMFNLVSGAALLLSSVIAGALWEGFGPAFTFYAGAGFCLLTLIGLAWIRPRKVFR